MRGMVQGAACGDSWLLKAGRLKEKGQRIKVKGTYRIECRGLCELEFGFVVVFSPIRLSTI